VRSGGSQVLHLPLYCQIIEKYSIDSRVSTASAVEASDDVLEVLACQLLAWILELQWRGQNSEMQVHF
jgi:hypothetical protein